MFCRVRPGRLPQFSARKVPVQLRLIPVSRRGQLPVEIVPKLLLPKAQLKRVEPVDDLAHQLAHFTVADPRNLRPRDLTAIGIRDDHVGIVATVADGARAGMKGFKLRITDTDKRQALAMTEAIWRSRSVGMTSSIARRARSLPIPPLWSDC